MENDASLEGRLRYIEQASQQLKENMKGMKTLVTTNVDELRGDLRHEVEDMKQMIIHQDTLYSQRINRLEERVQQLAEFAMHLAQSKGMAGSLRTDSQQVPLHVESPPTRRTVDIEPPTSAGPALSLGGAMHDEDDDRDGRGGYQAVLVKYSEKINQVYRHYTETASRALHPVMTLQQFTKLTKDCGLCNSSQGGTVAVNAYLPPPELLWMNVLRRLPQKKKGKLGGGNFAFERVQEVTREVFPDVLVVLAEEQYGRDRADMDRAQVVELFLVNDLFSVTDQKIAASENQRLMEREKRHSSHAASSINDYYDNDEVRECLKQYRTKINNTYVQYARKSRDGTPLGLTLQGFSDIVKNHGLLPLIQKADVREIFLNVRHTQEVLGSAVSVRGSGRSGDEHELDKKGFSMALRHLAEHIYGDRTLAEKYPTPDARFKKLMAKMYLLGGS